MKPMQLAVADVEEEVLQPAVVADLDEIGADQREAEHVLVERARRLHVLRAEIDVVQAAGLEHVGSPWKSGPIAKSNRIWIMEPMANEKGKLVKIASVVRILDDQAEPEAVRLARTILRMRSCERPAADPMRRRLRPSAAAWRIAA